MRRVALLVLAFSLAGPARAAAPTNAPGFALFDGRSLAGWTVTDFAGHGEVRAEDGVLALGEGYITGVTWTNALPATNRYEITLEAKRVAGNDFFCGLTFPVAGTNATFIVGGWGGGVTGISNVDGEDASMNETTRIRRYEAGRWYALRLRVTPAKLEAWVDQEQVVDLELAGKALGLRPGPIHLSAPLGFAAFSTTAHLRNIRLTRLP
ncbi:MAG: DUF1080 domain-containing protein [Limisphaerales bacterium]